MGEPAELSSAPSRGTATRPLLAAAVWLLGTTAAIAGVGFGDLRNAAIAAVLAVWGVVLVWVLDLRPRTAHRFGYLASAAAAALVAFSSLTQGYLRPVGVVAVGTTLAYGALVRWSLPRRWPQRTGAVAGPAVGLIVVDMLLWYREPRPALFALLALAAIAVLEVYARAHRVADAIDHGVARFAHGVGAAVTWVLGGLVMVVAIIPINLVSRLFRYSPLEPGWANSSTAFVQVDPRRQRRPDGAPANPRSMAMLEVAPARRVRRRSRARMVVPVGAAIAVFIAIAGVPTDLRLPDPPWSGDGGDQAATTTVPRDTFTQPFEDDPAFADAPWAKDLRLDLLDAWKGLQFNGAVGGWQLRDVSSEYINVTDGERATRPPKASLGDPVVVWFFGGSAAFGAGQRDEHTIPSELVALAEADGIPLEIHNKGVPATVNWQSVMLLLEQLTWHEPPDLIVFYDGANDLSLQGVLAGQGKGDSSEPASLADAQLDQVLRERAAERGQEGSDLSQDTTTTEAGEPLAPEASGELVLERYGKGIETARRTAAASSVPIRFFWQPDLRGKAPLTDTDRDTLDSVGQDDDAVQQWAAASDVVRGGLEELDVADLTAVFDGVDEPLYWDQVHTNEAGAALVAQALYDDLKPTVEQLRPAGS